MLRKGVYSYEYMDDWEKVNEPSLFEKEDFYSHLNVEDITDADYTTMLEIYNDLQLLPERT